MSTQHNPAVGDEERKLLMSFWARRNQFEDESFNLDGGLSEHTFWNDKKVQEIVAKLKHRPTPAPLSEGDEAILNEAEMTWGLNIGPKSNQFDQNKVLRIILKNLIATLRSQQAEAVEAARQEIVDFVESIDPISEREAATLGCIAGKITADILEDRSAALTDQTKDV